MTALVVRSDSAAVATLVLTRPEQRNATSDGVFRELRRQIKAIEGDPAIGLLVIRGAGGHFCAGHDLAASARSDPVGWIRHELHTFELLTRLRQPVIAAVEGSCFTGGLELALAADFIACDETARMILANSWHSNTENTRLAYNTDGMRLSEGLDRDAAKRRSACTRQSRPVANGATGG